MVVPVTKNNNPSERLSEETLQLFYHRLSRLKNAKGEVYVSKSF